MRIGDFYIVRFLENNILGVVSRDVKLKVYDLKKETLIM